MAPRVSTVTEIVKKKDEEYSYTEYAADLDQALNVAGVGWYNLKYCLVLALLLIAPIVESVGYSYILPASRCDLGMTDAQRGFIASIPYIGTILMSFPCGYLVDTRGRKRVVVWSSACAGVLAVLAAFMPTLASFVVFKFLSSLFIVGPSTIPYTLLGELTPQRHRDLLLSVTNGLQITGSALVPLLAWAFLPLDFRITLGSFVFRPWRLLCVIYASIFLVAAGLMALGPESPKFLLAAGRPDAARAVLAELYAGNKRKSPKDFPIKKLKESDIKSGVKPGFLTSLKDQSVPLLRAPYHKWLALNGFLLFGVFATLNGLYVWVPDILNRVLTGDGTGLTACQVIEQRLNETGIVGECVDTIATSTFVINFVGNASCAVLAVAGSAAVRLTGKKTLLVVVFGVIGMLCAVSNVITEDVLFAVFFSSFPSLGMAIGPINAYAVEIFPTNLRGMAISLTMMVGRLGSVVGTNVAGALFAASCPTTFYVFGGSLILCSLSSLLLPRPLGSSPTKQDKISTRL